MNNSSKNPPHEPESAAETQDRRSADRNRDDVDWESKVVGRLGGRLKKLPQAGETKDGGWEAEVVDSLRRRIERKPPSVK